MLFAFSSVSAVAFGASPATLSFELTKGGSDTQILTVSTASEKPLDVFISVSDNLKNFVSYSPNSNLKVDVKNPLEIEITAKASKFAKSGVYEGTITASTTSSSADNSGTASSAISTGVAIKTVVKIGQTTSTQQSQETETEQTNTNTEPPTQNTQQTIPLSSGSSGLAASTLIVFAATIIIGCVILAVIYSKRRKK